ncbi:GWxTD domain-containing protein [Gracilimonas mengyeensis]|uniref:GWxTD domain-containing protein n=1 Tax=Gracilimonas mengyeensis TaxID=1302730 RepID=A0A521F4H8_9BACT|nr:GWxTD domain-containing protein [Gracilimonas mengyeensis]SMO91097.1 GWxTD domain-containing protein [Gracilimonas mengyeensis]
MKRSGPVFFLLLFLGFIIAGCARNYYDNIDRGEGYNYRPGYPELRLAATGYVSENSNTYINVAGDIVYGSLVYSGKDDIFTADVEIEIQIIEDTEQQRAVERTTFSKTLTSQNQRVIDSQDVYSFEREFDIPAGNYIVRVGVIDKSSGQQTLRTTKTSIPDPSENTSHITEVRILTKNNNLPDSEFKPATTYDIQSSQDSIKFVFQVTNNNPDRPIEIESRLLKFRSDTSIARPMNFNNYSPSSLPYQGIDYDEYDVIQSSTRQLNQPGSVIIEFAFTDLERGNYRLEVIGNEGSDNEIFKGRDFGIKSPNYPSLKTPEELARPLYYLMGRNEYKDLMAIKDPDSLKKAIDRFWLSNIQNSNMARSVISLYYERVEEANKQFSNFKEGWKTDPGMMYILFGPPWYTDIFSDEMYWSYSYNREDPEKNFYFNKTKLNSKYYPFDNFLLQRSNFYYNIQSQQIERWRTGLILNYNL